MGEIFQRRHLDPALLAISIIFNIALLQKVSAIESELNKYKETNSQMNVVLQECRFKDHLIETKDLIINELTNNNDSLKKVLNKKYASEKILFR